MGSEKRTGREDDSEDVMRVVEEFVRLHDAGEAISIEAFAARQPEHLRDEIREGCRDVLRIERVINSPGADDLVWRNPVGYRLGDFEILCEIDRGGMGVVYLANQISLNREVALKVLPHHLTLSGRNVERFQREARNVAKLKHPGIVSVYTVGQDAGVHYIAMELVDGGDLHKELTGSGDEDAPARPVSVREKARDLAEVVAEIAEALQYAHDRGIIHRDIKPRNILMDAEGHPHIADFGLAKDVSEASISRPGDLAGTPHYMSPEQALAKRVQVDHRTDVFSLGVVFYEMLTLHRPFEGDTSEEVLYNITFAEPPPVSRFDPEVPHELEVLCAKAMEKNPEHRFQAAGELAEELRRFLAGDPIRTRPPRLPTRLWRRIKRRPAVPLAAAGVVVALTAGFLFGAIRAADREPSATVSGLAPDHAGALVSYRSIDPLEANPGEKVEVGRGPIAGEPFPLGPVRVVVENGADYAELTRMIADEGGDYSFEATIRPTGQVTESKEAPMVLIPAGEFVFGRRDGAKLSPVFAQRRVHLEAFWIDRHEVSNGQYREFLRESGHPSPGIWPEPFADEWNDLPVTGVSFLDARAYAEWAGKRLPTVYEWEKAARGTEGFLLPWGDTDEGYEIEDLANVGRPFTTNDADRFQNYLDCIEPVDSRPEAQSPFGLHHVLGNALEWTETVLAVPDPETGRLRTDSTDYVLKGGAYDQPEGRQHLEYIQWVYMAHDSQKFGFRCAKSVDP